MKKWLVYLAGAAGFLMVIIGIIFKIKHSAAIAVIGGADGPTSVFIAGKAGDGLSMSLIAVGIALALIFVWLFRKK